MKVLKRGAVEDPKTWTIEIDCHPCGSRLEVGAVDIRRRAANPFEGRTTYHTRCPVCQSELDIYRQHLPVTVRNYLEMGLSG